MRIERRGTGAFMNDRQRKTAISIRGLIKRYPDGTVANRGIDLDVYEGEVLSILGPNGAGKTTFVRQITVELKPTSGSIKIKDVNPLLEPLKAKRLMGVIPQEGALFSHLTVQEHLNFFGRLKGLTGASSCCGWRCRRDVTFQVSRKPFNTPMRDARKKSMD